MAQTQIVTPSIDIVELLLSAIDIPTDTDALADALDAVAGKLTREEYDAIWMAAMTAINQTEEMGFRLGWEMRGQV